MSLWLEPTVDVRWWNPLTWLLWLVVTPRMWCVMEDDGEDRWARCWAVTRTKREAQVLMDQWIKDPTMLVLSRERGETIVIGDDIKITVVDIRGEKVRLGIDAPARVPVHRKEVYEAIERNKTAHLEGRNP